MQVMKFNTASRFFYTEGYIAFESIEQRNEMMTKWLEETSREERSVGTEYVAEERKRIREEFDEELRRCEAGGEAFSARGKTGLPIDTFEEFYEDRGGTLPEHYDHEVAYEEIDENAEAADEVAALAAGPAQIVMTSSGGNG